MNKNFIRKMFPKFMERMKYVVVFLIALFSIWAGLYWVLLALVFWIAILKVFLWTKQFYKNLWLNGVLNVMLLALFAIFIRVFIFEIYLIPTTSMENTLFPGDVILVSKLTPGPKLPQTPQEIPWLNLFFTDTNFISERKYTRGNRTDRRLPGFSSVKNGDILVFKKREITPHFLIKRCLGLPGDKFQMRNSRVILNDRLAGQLPTVKKKYGIRFLGSAVMKNLANSLKFQIISQVDSFYVAAAFLTESEYLGLKNGPEQLLIYPINNSLPAYPDQGNTRWTIDNLGPLRIPFKGMKILLNGSSYFLYRSIIKQDEGVRLERKGERFFINGKLTVSYEFRKNYYFMLGDNRDRSLDSRSWGFVAETDLIGKYVAKLF